MRDVSFDHQDYQPRNLESEAHFRGFEVFCKYLDTEFSQTIFNINTEHVGAENEEGGDKFFM